MRAFAHSIQAFLSIQLEFVFYKNIDVPPPPFLCRIVHLANIHINLWDSKGNN